METDSCFDMTKGSYDGAAIIVLPLLANSITSSSKYYQ